MLPREVDVVVKTGTSSKVITLSACALNPEPLVTLIDAGDSEARRSLGAGNVN